MSCPPVGVVLAGGSSTRMGTDKALVEVDGRPMVRAVADALEAGGCVPVRCQGGDAASLAQLGLETWPDPEGRRGPVRAIRDALAAIDTTGGAVIAACDLPALDGGLVRSLVAARDESARVAVAVAGGRRHLVAAWPPGVAADVARLVDDGVSSYRELLERLGAVEVEVDAGAVRNVNRPADVSRADGSWAVSSPTMSVQEITVDELAARLADGARLVDVREPAEFEQARVDGARLVPLGTVPVNVDAFRGDGPVYVICRSGARSLHACEYLATEGVEAVNVAGGTLAWIDSGRDVVVGPA